MNASRELDGFCSRWLLALAFALPVHLLSAQNLDIIDSLRQHLLKAPEEQQFELLCSLGFEYRFSIPDSTIYYSNRAYALGQKIRIAKGLSRPLSFIGLAKANQGEYTEALDYHTRSLAIAESQHDTLQMAHGHNNIGRIYFDKGDLVRAYNEFARARDLFEVIGDRAGLAYVYRSLANVFKTKEDLPKALENSQRALLLRKQMGDLRGITSAYMELGLVYQDMDTTPLALRQFELADSVASIMNDRMTKAEITVGIAEILLQEGDIEKTISLVEDVLTSVSQRVNQKVFLRARLLLARCRMAEKSYDKALPILLDVYKVSEGSGNLTFERDAAQLLSQVYAKKGRALEAKEYQHIFELLQTKIQNEDLNREIERLQFQLVTEKTEKENELLRAQQARDEAVIAEQRFQNTLMLIILVFGGILVILTWVVSRKRKEVNQRLEDQNQHIRAQREEIVKQNEILSQSNRDLDLLNHEKDTLMNIVAHDLKAPLNRISGLAQILEFEAKANPQQMELIRLIKDCAGNGSDLITGLLDVHALNEGREAPRPEAISFDAFIKEVAQPYHALAEAKGSRIQGVNRIEGRVICDPSYLGRIIDNLLSNAIKFSPRNAVIEVHTEWKSGCIYLSVKDQGPGFTKQDQAHLYEKFKRLSAQPTAGESSHGLGLAIVKTLVDRLGGTIELTTGPAGTTFLVRIPAELL